MTQLKAVIVYCVCLNIARRATLRVFVVVCMYFNRHFTIYIKKLVSLADRQRVWRRVDSRVDHAVRHKCSNVRAIDRSVVQYVYCAPP